MFEKVKKFYDERTFECQMAIGWVAGVVASIPLIKWIYKEMARAVTIGINNSNLTR